MVCGVVMQNARAGASPPQRDALCTTHTHLAVGAELKLQVLVAKLAHVAHVVAQVELLLRHRCVCLSARALSSLWPATRSGPRAGDRGRAAARRVGSVPPARAAPFAATSTHKGEGKGRGCRQKLSINTGRR